MRRRVRNAAAPWPDPWRRHVLPGRRRPARFPLRQFHPPPPAPAIRWLARIGVQFRRARQQRAGHVRRGGRVARAALPDFSEVVGGAPQRDAAQAKLRLGMSPRRGAPIPGRRLDRIPGDAQAVLVELPDTVGALAVARADALQPEAERGMVGLSGEGALRASLEPGPRERIRKGLGASRNEPGRLNHGSRIDWFNPLTKPSSR